MGFEDYDAVEKHDGLSTTVMHSETRGTRCVTEKESDARLQRGTQFGSGGDGHGSLRCDWGMGKVGDKWESGLGGRRSSLPYHTLGRLPPSPRLARWLRRP